VAHTHPYRENIFKNPEEFSDRVESYFIKCEENNKPPTISGLSVFCKCHRSTLYNYADPAKCTNPEFGKILDYARLRIQEWCDTELLSRERPNSVTGVIFYLKNHYDYKDSSSVEHSGAVSHNLFLSEMIKKSKEVK